MFFIIDKILLALLSEINFIMTRLSNLELFLDYNLFLYLSGIKLEGLMQTGNLFLKLKNENSIEKWIFKISLSKFQDISLQF